MPAAAGRLALVLSLLLALPARADVTHVVFCWFRADAPVGTVQAALDGASALAAIPGVLELKKGVALASDRPIVDDTFQLGMTMRFADVETMRTYLAHPDHVRYVDTLVKPFAERILIYDIVQDPAPASPAAH
jgi:Stress responsive A/B Barrel Domain